MPSITPPRTTPRVTLANVSKDEKAASPGKTNEPRRPQTQHSPPRSRKLHPEAVTGPALPAPVTEVWDDAKSVALARPPSTLFGLDLLTPGSEARHTASVSWPCQVGEGTVRLDRLLLSIQADLMGTGLFEKVDPWIAGSGSNYRLNETWVRPSSMADGARVLADVDPLIFVRPLADVSADAWKRTVRQVLRERLGTSNVGSLNEFGDDVDDPLFYQRVPGTHGEGHADIRLLRFDSAHEPFDFARNGILVSITNPNHWTVFRTIDPEQAVRDNVQGVYRMIHALARDSIKRAFKMQLAGSVPAGDYGPSLVDALSAHIAARYEGDIETGVADVVDHMLDDMGRSTRMTLRQAAFLINGIVFVDGAPKTDVSSSLAAHLRFKLKYVNNVSDAAVKQLVSLVSDVQGTRSLQLLARLFAGGSGLFRPFDASVLPSVATWQKVKLDNTGSTRLFLPALEHYVVIPEAALPLGEVVSTAKLATLSDATACLFDDDVSALWPQDLAPPQKRELIEQLLSLDDAAHAVGHPARARVLFALAALDPLRDIDDRLDSLCASLPPTEHAGLDLLRVRQREARWQCALADLEAHISEPEPWRAVRALVRSDAPPEHLATLSALVLNAPVVDRLANVEATSEVVTALLYAAPRAGLVERGLSLLSDLVLRGDGHMLPAGKALETALRAQPETVQSRAFAARTAEALALRGHAGATLRFLRATQGLQRSLSVDALKSLLAGVRKDTFTQRNTPILHWVLESAGESKQTANVVMSGKYAPFLKGLLQHREGLAQLIDVALLSTRPSSEVLWWMLQAAETDPGAHGMLLRCAAHLTTLSGHVFKAWRDVLRRLDWCNEAIWSLAGQDRVMLEGLVAILATPALDNTAGELVHWFDAQPRLNAPLDAVDRLRPTLDSASETSSSPESDTWSSGLSSSGDAPSLTPDKVPEAVGMVPSTPRSVVPAAVPRGKAALLSDDVNAATVALLAHLRTRPKYTRGLEEICIATLEEGLVAGKPRTRKQAREILTNMRWASESPAKLGRVIGKILVAAIQRGDNDNATAILELVYDLHGASTIVEANVRAVLKNACPDQAIASFVRATALHSVGNLGISSLTGDLAVIYLDNAAQRFAHDGDLAEAYFAQGLKMISFWHEFIGLEADDSLVRQVQTMLATEPEMARLVYRGITKVRANAGRQGTPDFLLPMIQAYLGSANDVASFHSRLDEMLRCVSGADNALKFVARSIFGNTAPTGQWRPQRNSVPAVVVQSIGEKMFFPGLAPQEAQRDLDWLIGELAGHSDTAHLWRLIEAAAVIAPDAPRMALDRLGTVALDASLNTPERAVRILVQAYVIAGRVFETQPEVRLAYTRSLLNSVLAEPQLRQRTFASIGLHLLTERKRVGLSGDPEIEMQVKHLLTTARSGIDGNLLLRAEALSQVSTLLLRGDATSFKRAIDLLLINGSALDGLSNYAHAQLVHRFANVFQQKSRRDLVVGYFVAGISTLRTRDSGRGAALLLRAIRLSRAFSVQQKSYFEHLFDARTGHAAEVERPL